MVASAIVSWGQNGFREPVKELADIITTMVSGFYLSVLVSPEMQSPVHFQPIGAGTKHQTQKQ